MTNTSMQTVIESEGIPALAIALEKACWVVIKSREFHVKDVSTVSDRGSNATDDNMLSVLEDRSDDPVEDELKEFISSLSDDEQADLVALAWLGRDDNQLSDWPSLREEAARAGSDHRGHTAGYLLGEPLLSDFLEEALSLFGQSCEAYELNRL